MMERENPTEMMLISSPCSNMTELIFPNALFSKMKLIIIHSDSNWWFLGVMYQEGSSTHSEYEWIKRDFNVRQMMLHIFPFQTFWIIIFRWKLIPHIHYNVLIIPIFNFNSTWHHHISLHSIPQLWWDVRHILWACNDF